MPPARGLFHRAIVQSGPGLRAKLPEQATEVAEKVLSELGISSDQHALETVPIERLRDAQGQFGGRGVFAFSPVLDGINVADHPGRAIKNGTAADVPIPIGCNRDEATLFLARDPAFADGASFDEASLSKRLASLGEGAAKIIDVYRRARSDATPRELLIAIESDRMMRVPSISLAELKLEGGKTPVYMYLFCWAAGPLGSAHGYEVPFVFDNARPPMMQESDERRALAARMSEAWIAFARSGAPDHAGIPSWPAYSVQERATMIFDRGESCVASDPFGEERAAWEYVQVPRGMPV